MPRLVYKLPAYSLHKPSGQAKVRHNGKTKYLGKYGSPESKEAYAAFIASLPKPTEQGRLAAPAPGVPLMVGDCVKRYQAHADRYYVHADGSQTGEAQTIRILLRPLVQMFDDLDAIELGPKKLKQVREELITRGWTRYSINKSAAVIKRCFTWCASEELIPPHIAMGLKTVVGIQKNRTAAREKAPIGPVADEMIEAILPHVSDLVADAIRTMRLTGMRPGEVLAMTADEIDRTDPTCWVYRPGHHKTAHHDKTRVVFIGARAQETILPRLMKAGPGERLFPMTRAALRWGVVRGCARAFPHPTIRQIKPKKRTEAQKAELRTWNKAHSWHPNQIRHTAATEFRSKFGLEAAQVLLGHSRADVTQTYAERDMKQAREVARKIG
jgi:integrase